MTPPISTTPSPATGTVGVAGTFGDSATITGNDGVVPGGTVTFTLYASDCSTIELGPSSGQTLSSDSTTPASASASYSASWTPPAAGTYYWVAVYSGDGNYNTVTDDAACNVTGESVTISSPASQITPTNTTCAQFASGTAATLSQIQYSLKGGLISQVNPGVFFYWLQVPTAGTYSITQTRRDLPCR